MLKVLSPTLIFLSVLTLTACFGPGDNTVIPDASSSGSPSEELKAYDNGEVFFTFPSNWDVIQPKDFTSEIPEATQVVVRNNIKNETFTANVNIVRNQLQQEISTLDYAKEVITRQQSGLIDYRETSRDLVSINIGSTPVESYLVEFEARLNATDPPLNFIQTFAVSGTNGYIILGATSLQEQSTVVNSVSNIVQSFKLM